MHSTGLSNWCAMQSGDVGRVILPYDTPLTVCDGQQQASWLGTSCKSEQMHCLADVASSPHRPAAPCTEAAMPSG